eukprot:12377500-Karenia_brevis.AAC.1
MRTCASTGSAVTWTHNMYEHRIVASYVHKCQLGHPLASPKSLLVFAMRICTATGGVVTWTQNLYEDKIVGNSVHKC